MNLFIFVVGVILTVKHVSAKEKVVGCYYGTWATYRNGLGKFDVSNINVDLCTHLMYTFVGINNVGTIISLDPYLDFPDNWGRDNFGKFNALKNLNPKLKTLLAVGGWNEGSARYSNMAASPTLRNNFITSAVNMIRKYGFDGLDIDWEYPNRRDSVNGQADIDNYTQLLKELRHEFDNYGLLLTAAVASVGNMASLSYDIPAISQYLDLINLMTYDMYGPWDPVTGHNAPLHKGEGDENESKENLNTVDVALEYWLNQGCPPEKLVLGLPLYGHTYNLANPAVNTVRAPSSGPGFAGPHTATNGHIGYNEFCDKIRTENWALRYDSLAKVPYAVQGQNWVSYDDSNSLVTKIEYALKFNIAGVMVWSIETDDFHGICHAEDFPLLKAINRALGIISTTTTTSTSSSSILTTTTPASSTTTTAINPTTTSSSATASSSSTTTSSSTSSSTTTSSSTSSSATTSSSTSETTPPSSVCKEEGLNPNPRDCSSFYICVQSLGSGYIAHLMHCPDGLYWDQSIKTCNYPDQVPCYVY